MIYSVFNISEAAFQKQVPPPTALSGDSRDEILQRIFIQALKITTAKHIIMKAVKSLHSCVVILAILAYLSGLGYLV